MIDFSNIRNIAIPEGEVISIARGAEILWQKQQEQKYKRELEYIEGTGTQYIDTGFIPNQDTRVLTEHSYTKHPANRGFIYGAGVSATSRAFEMYTWGSNWNSPYGDNNMTMAISSSFLIGDKITINKSKNNVIIQYADGTSQTKTTQYVTFEAPRNMWLFAINRGNTSADLRTDCLRLYYCKIWDNGTLIRDFIPVLDWNDIPCMYDKVSGELFYNQGTGVFAYGELPSEDARLPAEYQEVEYLEGDGKQYIQTNVVFNNTDECYLEATLLTTGGDKFCIAPTKWNNNNNRFGMAGRLSNVYCAAYGATSTSFTKYVPEIYVNSDKHIFTYKDKIFTIEDLGSIYDATKSIWGGDTTELRLFYGYNAPTACRIYYYEQKRDGITICELVPCYRKSDSKAGMYDLVTNTFLENKGTGEFLIG